MEALRLTIHSALLTPLFDVPPTLRDQEVDVVVLPKLEETKERPHSPERKSPKRESMMGCLSEYANPALRELEKGA